LVTSCVRIGQGNLPVRGIAQGFVHCLQPRDLLLDTAVAAGKVQHFPGAGLILFLPVSHISSTLRPASRSSLRLDGIRFR